jgi:EAL domain-containing protein (putative c-di-GMP-specific phosphodiesterase class I)/AmiR/NasT family two-component response regulator
LADIRVIIADDEKAVRDALADLVEACDGLTVVAVAADADEAIAAAVRLRPDVALVDVRMPGGGPRATLGIRQSSPHTRVLALSASESRDTVLEMLQAGAAGYLVKGVMPTAVIEGIRHVAQGQTPISAEVAGGVIQGLRAQLATEHQEHQHRQRLLDQLSTALDGDGLDMVYQPIYDLETHELVGVEALARFSLEPQRPPNEWFAAAAEVGLATRLEVSAVTRAIARRSELPPGIFMAVNLSTEALMSPEVRGVIPEGFADRLVIELTEHTPVLDYEALGLAFAPLRASGTTLAIDDAGAGYASLRHLLELAPQFIKLDISITQKIEHDRAAFALAVALTSFARAIDARIIAEGIETESQLSAVRSLGVELGQGYHLGKPGPIELLAARAPVDSGLAATPTG